MLAMCPIRDHRTPLGVPCSELFATTLHALEEVQRNKITAEAFEDWFRYSALNKDEAELLELISIMTFEGHVVNAELNPRKEYTGWKQLFKPASKRTEVRCGC